jgi:cystathionine gamma-lyase
LNEEEHDKILCGVMRTAKSPINILKKLWLEGQTKKQPHYHHHQLYNMSADNNNNDPFLANKKPFAHFGTDAIHAGQEPDPHTGAVITPISLSSTFAQKSPGVKYSGAYEYARTNNPTRQSFEQCLAKLENGQFGAAFSSGLGCTSTLLHLLKQGDHVVVVDDVYGGTGRYFRTIASEFGITFTFLDFNEEGALEKAFTENTKMVWLETPTNPTLRISDIAKTAELSHKHGAILVVDNTFMSPYFQRPLDLGADVVMHSVTKYIGGHSDTVMGALVVNDADLFKRIKYLQNSIGMIPSPFDCFLALRSLKTLHVRMPRHAENAQKVAEFLESHDKIDKVIFPGLKSHPQYELGLKQMTGPGGMITFWLKGDITQARQFLENVQVFTLAESLGGVESLVNHPAIMTHASVPIEHRRKLGISDSLVRLSVGIEDVDDLINDLKEALDHVTL